MSRFFAARRCRIGVVLIALACMWPRALPARPAEASKVDPAAFDVLFLEGEKQSSRGEFVQAARTWTRAANYLPVDDEENRRSLYDYIAEAYANAVGSRPDRADVEEAVQALDHYASAFTAAHPDAPLNPKGAMIHEELRARLAALTSVQDVPAPAGEGPLPPPSAPPARAWKGLMIGGGVATGLGLAMLGMFVGGYVRTTAHERDFDDPNNMCYLGAPQNDCQKILDRGERADVVAVIGLAAAPALLAAGATMLGIAARRKSSPRPLAPMLGPNMAGAIWRLSF
ncbi:hypothetical protein [Nannocystis pusilla]|uniref:hypothetical protein n=1 Tax=Nannocystis pusilla TaxID=889268 RepID=UPI003BF4429F